MISALERFSFAVIVMFRVSPKVASEVLWALLLYMVRFEIVGFVRSIVRFEEFRFAELLLGYFPARSNAVMLKLDLAISVACIYYTLHVCYLC